VLARLLRIASKPRPSQVLPRRGGCILSGMSDDAGGLPDWERLLAAERHIQRLARTASAESVGKVKAPDGVAEAAAEEFAAP